MQKRETVFITGANQGLGYETAKQLIGNNYFVYLGSRNIKRGEETATKLEDLGLVNFKMVQIDVTDNNSIKAAAQELQQSVPQLDVLINNAGISGPMPSKEETLAVLENPAPGVVTQQASTLGIEEIRNVFDVNFFGAIQVTQALIPLLKKSSHPRIVNVTSSLGSLANHSDPAAPWYDFFKKWKLAAYNSSKAALNAYTVMLAAELENTPFKVNSITPGFAATNLNNYAGTQSPVEAAKVIFDYATIGENGPTGKFYDENGELAW